MNIDLSCMDEEIDMEHILLVDDEEDLIWSMSKSLSFHGFKVSTACNGPQALQQIQSQRPDLLLLDIAMPGTNGIEFCSQLRENPQLRTLPVIFLTGHADLRNKIAAYTVGADDYVGKPFDMYELRLRINVVLRRAKSKATEPKLVPEPQYLEVGALCLDVRKATVATENGTVSLTPTELNLLKYLMQHVNEIISNEQLLQKVWACPANTGDPAVVRWHIKNLRLKLEISPEHPIYLHTVLHYGYVLTRPLTMTDH